MDDETPKYLFLGGVSLKYIRAMNDALNAHPIRHQRRRILKIRPSRRNINRTRYSRRRNVRTRRKYTKPMLLICCM